MTRYAILSSGSCGNSYIFSNNDVTILIDFGITLTALERKANEFKFDLNTLKAIFITHLHPDHIKSVAALKRRYNVDVYLSFESLEKEERGLRGLKLEKNKLKTFNFNNEIIVNSFTIYPIKTSHDSIGSTAYTIKTDDRSFMLLTDLGYTNDEMITLANEVDTIFLESNYDEELLAKSQYPLFLKKRINGALGHLSNRQAIDFVKQLKLNKKIYFIHLSQNCNDVKLLESQINKEFNNQLNYKICARSYAYLGDE